MRTRLRIAVALLAGWLGPLAGEGGGTLTAQQPLRSVAEAARRAVDRGDLPALFLRADRVQLELPEVHPSSAVGVGQAIAALRGAFARSGDHRVTVAQFREVGEGRGYVELEREVQGGSGRGRAGGGRQRQRILLGYRWDGDGWRLVEVRVY